MSLKSNYHFSNFKWWALYFGKYSFCLKKIRKIFANITNTQKAAGFLWWKQKSRLLSEHVGCLLNIFLAIIKRYSGLEKLMYIISRPVYYFNFIIPKKLERLIHLTFLSFFCKHRMGDIGVERRKTERFG